MKEKVAIIGSGNWGSAVSKIIGNNCKLYPEYDEEVRMYVYEELIDGCEKLTDIINRDHENVKYLPNVRLPTNVVAVPDVVKAVEGATILVFVVPHQFLKSICAQLKPVIHGKPVLAVSLIKGMFYDPEHGMTLVSTYIRTLLGIPSVSVLMGANIANEVAAEQFCESTLGFEGEEKDAERIRRVFHTKFFRVTAVPDVPGVEVCGTLKNVVALAAGFVDGLGLGNNTKAAIIRIGLKEMQLYSELMFPNRPHEHTANTIFESCGVADVITTCYGGRNRKCAEEFARSGKTFTQVEAEVLHGQKCQGYSTAEELHSTLAHAQVAHRFPLFERVYRICYEGAPVDSILEI